MSSTVGYGDQYWNLKRYVIIGLSRAGHPYYAFWTMYDSIDQAKYTAMAWAVSGFSSRVIDTKFGVQDITDNVPTLAFQFGTLQTVTTLVPKVTSVSLQLVPPDVPWPIVEADFYTWLIAFSKSTPTWTAPSSSTGTQVGALGSVVLLDSLTPEQRTTMNSEPRKPITIGVQHIAGQISGDTLCGCRGHVEPDWPYMKPLSRDVEYCKECLSFRTIHHNDHMRGWGRLQMQNMGSPVPVNEALIPMLWEDKKQLSQAEPMS